jgi:succinate-semialdehyde dehydrogenase/glutarate-semialdehyde dehydrogenase
VREPLAGAGRHRRPFVAALAARVRAMKEGPGTDAGVAIGPLINDAALAKVERHVADATAHAAQVVVGGQPHALGGTFYAPTLLTGVTPGMAMMNEETFGPVAGITRFRNEDDAVRIANETPFGLAAYLYARDAARIWRVAEALETGMLGINTGLLSSAEVPFGGVKESGLGREGSHEGIEEWLETKYLCWGGLEA